MSGEGLQQLVAGFCAVALIDAGEVVQIGVHHKGVVLKVPDPGIQEALDAIAVEQARQLVIVGHEFQGLTMLFALPDVAHHPHQTQCVAALEGATYAHFHVDQAAVGMLNQGFKTCLCNVGQCTAGQCGKIGHMEVALTGRVQIEHHHLLQLFNGMT